MSKENSNYKPTDGRSAEHFGFRLNSDGNVEGVCCVHCHKSWSLAFVPWSRAIKIAAFSVKPCRVF